MISIFDSGEAFYANCCASVYYCRCSAVCDQSSVCAGIAGCEPQDSWWGITVPGWLGQVDPDAEKAGQPLAGTLDHGFHQIQNRRVKRVLQLSHPQRLPIFVETVRPIYEDAELEKLFAHCTPAEEMRFKFYLMSGFRDAEGRFVTWRDVEGLHRDLNVV